MSAKRSLTRALTEFARPFGSRGGQRPRPLDLLLLEGTAPETVRQWLKWWSGRWHLTRLRWTSILFPTSPGLRMPRPLSPPSPARRGLGKGRPPQSWILTDERQREWFITLVPHSISAKIWGPTGSGFSFCASDTGSVIGWKLPAERWERGRVRLRHRGVDRHTATQGPPGAALTDTHSNRKQANRARRGQAGGRPPGLSQGRRPRGSAPEHPTANGLPRSRPLSMGTCRRRGRAGVHTVGRPARP